MKVLKHGAVTIAQSNLKDTQAAYDAQKKYSKDDECVFNKYIYKALSDELQGVAPDSDIKKWQKVSVSNEWACFDYFLNTISKANDEIDIVFHADGAKGIYLNNVLANTLLIEVLNTSAEILERAEYKLFEINSDILSWKSYFFGAWRVENRPKSVFYECTTLSNQRIFRVRASRAGGEVQIGSIIVGDIKELETTLYADNSISMIDFSKVTTDEDGFTQLVKGNYKRTNAFKILVDNANLDYVAYELTQLRGEACVFVIATNYECLINFAFLKTHEILLEKRDKTIVEIEIEGMV